MDHTLKKLLSSTAIVGWLVLSATHAYALGDLETPTGGQVVGGTAMISNPAAGLLNINQQTDRAVINWDSFNVGEKAKTEFFQPNAGSLVVNRVTGNNADPSQILGALKSNGRVMVLDRNGVFFGPNSRIDVGSIIAATGRVDTDAVMRGDTRLEITDFGGGSVVSEGLINVADTGIAAFVSPIVSNSGIINAKLGHVGFGTGSKVTLDLYGDSLLEIAVSDKMANALIRHSGTINAEGGSVLMTAQAAKSAVDDVINMSGVVNASSYQQQGGKIVLGGGAQGVVNISGKMDVSGVPAGSIRVTGQNILMDKDAVLAANGGLDGNGGSVVTIADTGMVFRGNISAQGGAASGNGGFVEVSGKDWLDFDGLVSTTAANGSSGTLLLDPTDITISSAANANVTAASPFQPNANDVVSVLNVTALQTALASGNVTVQTRGTGTQLGNLTVSNAVTWSANTLTLQADNDVILNADLIGSGTAGLIFQATANATTIGVAGGAGTFNLSTTDLSHITGSYGGVTIGKAAGTGAMAVNAATWSNPLTLLSGSGVITIAGAQAMGANNLTISANSNPVVNAALTGTGTLTLQGSAVGTTIGLGGGAGTFGLTAAELANITNGWSQINIGSTAGTGAMAVNAMTWNDNLSLLSGTGVITIAGAQAMGANNLTISANSNPVVNAALTGTGTLTLQGSAVGTTIGLGGGAGTFGLTAAELANITNGWSQINIGSTAGTGAMAVNAMTWNDNLSLLSGAGVITIAGAQTMGANNLTISANSNPVVNAALTGTGTLTLQGSAAATTIGLGGAAGTFGLTTAEIANITNGWSQINIGSTSATGALTANAATWNDNLSLFGGSGGIAINGMQTMGTNTFVAQTGGTGDITIAVSSGVTSTASGTAITLAAARNFINNGGSGALSAASGRWLVYSTTPGADTFGSLNSGNTAIWNTANGAAVSATGNRYAFSFAPTLTFTSTNLGKTYGDVADLTNSYSVSGLQAGVANAFLADTNATAFSGGPGLTSTGAAALASVGGSPYVINVAQGSLASASGYQFSYSSAGALTINKAHLTVTADNASRLYGDANPSFSATLSGFKNSETLGTSGVTGGASLATAATATTSVGTASITSAVGTLTAGNYDFTTFNNGTLTINKAHLTVAADSLSRLYGDANPTLTATFSGFKNSETLGTSGVAGTAALATAATATTSVGTASITSAAGTLTAGNYDFTIFNNGTLTINKAHLTVTADNASRLYGDANPSFSATLSGFKNSETLGTSGVTGAALLATAATATTNVGAASITSAAGTLTAGNYDFTTFNNGTLTITVRPLSVTANNTSKIYGSVDPVLTYASSGLVNGDVLAGTLSRAAGENVNTYAISQGTLAASGNYTLAYNAGGQFTISPYTLAVTANALSKVYGAADPALTYSYGTLQNNDTSAVFTGGLVRAAGRNAGAYDLHQGDLAAGSNYVINYAGSQLTITPVTLSLTGVTAANKSYDGTTVATLKTNLAALSGVLSGDNVTFVSGSGAFADKNVGTGKIVTASGFSLSGAEAGNYLLAQQPSGLIADITAPAVFAQSNVFNVVNISVNVPVISIAPPPAAVSAPSATNTPGGNTKGGGPDNKAEPASNESATVESLAGISPAAGGDDEAQKGESSTAACWKAAAAAAGTGFGASIAQLFSGVADCD